MTKSKFVSLKQFQNTTGVSDKALIALIDQAAIPMSLVDGKLLVNLGATSVETLVSASLNAHQGSLEPFRQLFVNRFAELIHESLDDLLDVALASIPDKNIENGTAKT